MTARITWKLFSLQEFLSGSWVQHFVHFKAELIAHLSNIALVSIHLSWTVTSYSPVSPPQVIRLNLIRLIWKWAIFKKKLQSNKNRPAVWQKIKNVTCSKIKKDLFLWLETLIWQRGNNEECGACFTFHNENLAAEHISMPGINNSIYIELFRNTSQKGFPKKRGESHTYSKRKIK